MEFEWFVPKTGLQSYSKMADKAYCVLPPVTFCENDQAPNQRLDGILPLYLNPSQPLSFHFCTLANSMMTLSPVHYFESRHRFSTSLQTPDLHLYVVLLFKCRVILTACNPFPTLRSSILLSRFTESLDTQKRPFGGIRTPDLCVSLV